MSAEEKNFMVGKPLRSRSPVDPFDAPLTEENPCRVMKCKIEHAEQTSSTSELHYIYNTPYRLSLFLVLMFMGFLTIWSIRLVWL